MADSHHFGVCSGLRRLSHTRHMGWVQNARGIGNDEPLHARPEWWPDLGPLHPADPHLGSRVRYSRHQRHPWRDPKGCTAGCFRCNLRRSACRARFKRAIAPMSCLLSSCARASCHHARVTVHSRPLMHSHLRYAASLWKFAGVVGEIGVFINGYVGVPIYLLHIVWSVTLLYTQTKGWVVYTKMS